MGFKFYTGHIWTSNLVRSIAPFRILMLGWSGFPIQTVSGWKGFPKRNAFEKVGGLTAANFGGLNVRNSFRS